MYLENAMAKISKEEEGLPSSARLLCSEKIKLAIELMKAVALQDIADALRGINSCFNDKLFTRDPHTGVNSISVKVKEK